MSFPGGKYHSDDPVYFGEGHYREPKEFFKRVVDLIVETHGSGPLSLVDAGCASGAFLHYARTRLDLRGAVGFDISPQHLEQARRHVEDVEFVEDSLLDLRTLRDRTFDVCTCLGTVSIFDDLAAVLARLLSLRKPSGSLFLYEPLNDDPVDVVMRFRRASDEDAEEWQPGFNIWSEETYRRTVAEVDPALQVTFVDFELPFDLPRGDDPLRAWTMKTQDSDHQLVVGTGQLLNFKIIRIGG
jgi:SAM-dependent methyltransferase